VSQTQKAGASPLVIAGVLAFLLALTYFALKRFATEPETDDESARHEGPDIDPQSDDSDPFAVDEPLAPTAKPAARGMPKASTAHRPRKRSR
jgi:hypothetical protein